jgi:dipeptidyl aminopeptidase/acylaminoacyl peptidase
VTDARSQARPWDIWTIGVDGADLVQVTRDPRDDQGPRWSRDGRFIYFVSYRTGRAEVWRAAATGGSIPCQSGWAVGPEGVFYAGCGSAEAPNGSRYPLRYWDAATGQDRQVGTLDAVYVAGLSVAPNGRTLVYGRSSWACDLMMIENSR